MKRVTDYILNQEWVVALLTLESLAFTVLEWTDLMPDGGAKTWVVGIALVVTGFIARVRVFAANTVKRLGELPEAPPTS